jgi:hypothetical protein
MKKIALLLFLLLSIVASADDVTNHKLVSGWPDCTPGTRMSDSTQSCTPSYSDPDCCKSDSIMPSDWNDEHDFAGGTTDGQSLIWKDANTDNAAWSANYEETTTNDFTLVDQNKTCFREGTGGGTNEVCVNAPATLAADRSCTLEDDSTPFDSCVTASSGDITDVWSATSGNVNALTAASGDSLDASAADTTKACKTGTSTPATCSVGECFFDTDATAG